MEFIQLWFAYNDDTYYVNDNITTSLDQYIYIRNKIDNKANGCSVVYLRLTNDTASFVSRYLGKDIMDILSGEKKIKQKVESEKKRKKIFAKMAKLLTEERTVIVTELADLHDLYEDESFSENMSDWMRDKKIKKQGAIAIKCPPQADELRTYLGDDTGKKMLSDLLGDGVSALYDTKGSDFFSALNNTYGTVCRFPNCFSVDMIKLILTAISCDKPERFIGMDDLEITAEFLNLFFSYPSLQQEYKLFPNDALKEVNTRKYKKLYDQLNTDRVWKDLRRAIRDAEKKYGSFSQFKTGLINQDVYRSELLICPSSEFRISYLNKFPQFRVPDNDQSESCNELIRKIFKLVSIVSIEPDPQYVSDLLNSLLNLLLSWQIDKMPKTFSRALETMYLTLEHLCGMVKANDEEKRRKIVTLFDAYIDRSKYLESKRFAEPNLMYEAIRAEYEENTKLVANMKIMIDDLMSTVSKSGYNADAIASIMYSFSEMMQKNTDEPTEEDQDRFLRDSAVMPPD